MTEDKHRLTDSHVTRGEFEPGNFSNDKGDNEQGFVIPWI